MAIQIPVFRKLVSSNPYFAKSTMDRVFVSIFVFGVHLAFWYEVFHVLPYYYAETTFAVVLHYSIAAVFYVGALSNLYKVIATRTDCTMAVLGRYESHDWPYCEKCCTYKPPRSHHCKLCDVCISQRDHHCWFSGCCIGHSNHRYYLSLVGYVFAAALYANVFHRQFAMDKLGHLGYLLPVGMIAPHVVAIFGYLSLYEFLISVLTSIALGCIVMFTWLVKLQVVQLFSGQTRHERKTKIFEYDNGLRQNLINLAGERWYVAWIWPWIDSPLPGNGMVFTKSFVKTK